MPSTFSIENINLNGSILTAENGRLYIDGEQVKNTSGIQLTERFFIKGYAPVSFYSRWATIGNNLNETLFNDKFMVTGMLISCANPATGSINLVGRFYAREPNSIIDSETIAYFTLPTRTVYINESINYKLTPPKILGIDIYEAPNELKSISLNLMGYSPAAGHFDKMPASISFYEKEYLKTGLGLEEKYNQYDGEYTGIKILSQSGGSQTIDREDIYGFASGFLNEQPKYALLSQSSRSGYIIDSVKYLFETGASFNQFNNIPQFFNIVSGYLYNGFQLSGDTNYFYSGYDSVKYGSGEVFEPIGARTVPAPELITGFISGYMGSGKPFVPLNAFSGFAGDPRIGNLPLTSGSSGFLIGSSGFYFDNSKYFFNTGIFFSGLDNFTGTISAIYGYKYYPIATNPDYLFDNYFTGLYSDGSGGYTGELRGYIGYRYVPSGQVVSGFIQVKSEFDFNFRNTENLPSNLSGISGYYLSGLVKKFKTGIEFSGFDNENGFEKNLGYEFFGYTNDNFISFSGIGINTIIKKPITGFVSGYLDEYNNFEIFSELKTSSGYIIDGIKYHFNMPKYFLSGELVVGYVSGYMDQSNNFSVFTGLYNISGIPNGGSGYFINNQRFEFPTGNNFTNFSGQTNFNNEYGYTYTGFSFPLGSGFSGIQFSNSGTGIITGYIGSRNVVVSTGVFSGIQSGMSGFIDNLGFEYIVNNDTFLYTNENFISDTEFPFGSGIITGNIGYKNVTGIDYTFGTGIINAKIGYRNAYNAAPMTGRFYYKNDDGLKIFGPYFELATGQILNRINLSNNVFKVPADRFVGIDIYRTLSGLNNFNTALFGYYE